MPPLPAEVRYTNHYTVQQVLQNPAPFLKDFVAHEKPFFEICRHPSGLIYDGWDLDPRTGKPLKPRPFSAPSKECLDLGVLVKVLEKDPLAAQLATPAQAADILTRKLAAYKDYEARFPQYAGFMPWVDLSGEKAVPTKEWQHNICGLDNGEWLWAMLAVPDALEKAGYEALARDYQDFNHHLQANVTRVFYDPDKQLVRGDPKIVPGGYETDPTRATWLSGEHGVHEGAMLVMYVCLYGKDIPVDKVWAGTKMVRVEHPTATTWQGWYSSSHEEWAYLFWPLRDLPEYRQLFHLREVIRTTNANRRGYPGFGSSILEPGGPGYLDASGIEDINSQKIRNNHLYALYGAFPLLLDNPAYGAAWLLNMLKGPRLQGPMGGGESGTNDGLKASASKTIDGTFSNLLAAMGGLERETAVLLKAQNHYDEFCRLMLAEYRETFTEPLRNQGELEAPQHPVPQSSQDYQ